MASEAKNVRTNLRVLRKSRKPPLPGDVFAMQLPAGEYLFGRVIVVDALGERAPTPSANLLYIYDHRSLSMEPDYSRLLAARLLIPPLWTNRLAWTKGYFITLENRPLGQFDLLREHCFQSAALRPDALPTFVDEWGRRRRGRCEPCGEWALVSYRWMDDRVSDAVGIPRVPED